MTDTPAWPRRKVEATFREGLPAGRQATFTYDGQLWIAVPMGKYKRLTGCIDRLLGLQEFLIQDMTRWINRRPEDAEFCVSVMQRVTKMKTAHRELVTEKMKAKTS